jgi:hypothetical protein
MTGPQQELKDHRIPLGRGHARGWGRVSIPADANPADDEFYFVHDEPAPRRTAVVVEDARAGRPLELAAAIAPDPSVRCSAEVVARDRLAEVDWDGLALLLWQAPLPAGDAAARVRAFLDRGGSAIFFPPAAPGDAEFLGLRWTGWASAGGKEGEGIGVEGWRGDEDVLAVTQEGAPLPVGTLRVRRSCGLAGESTPLATLHGGTTLLARAATGRGAAYFCATTPSASDSSLATDGVVLYVLVQRALSAGAALLGNSRQVVAGDPPADLPTPWERLGGPAEAVSTEYPRHRGVYAAKGKILAVNRPAAEDAAPVLADRRADGLFRGLDYDRIDDRAGGAGGLIREVWRLFLVAMMAALLFEAYLCLPKPRTAGVRP